MVPRVDRDDRRGMILVKDHLQPIGQFVFLELDSRHGTWYHVLTEMIGVE